MLANGVCGTELNTAGQELYNCRIQGSNFRLDWDDLKEGTWTVTLGMVEDNDHSSQQSYFNVTSTTAYGTVAVLTNHSIRAAVGVSDRLELYSFSTQVGPDEELHIHFDVVTRYAKLNSILLVYEEAPSQVADLAVEKLLVDPVTGDPIAGPVYPGDDIQFAITVENDGPNKASGVSILDGFPDGLIFNSASAGKGSYNESTGLWSIGTINDGISYTLTIDATVDPAISAPADLYNTAAVATTLQDNPVTPGPNSASVLVDVNQPNANIQVSQVGTTSAFPGDPVTFTVTVTNAGPKDAASVEITDLLGDGLDFVSPPTPSEGSVSVTEDPAGDDTLVWTIPALALGGSETLVIEATVNSGISTFPTDIDNIATRTASTPVDLTAGDNSDTVTVTVNDPRIDLHLEKSVIPTNPSEGASFTYTLTLTNEASHAAATGVTVTDTLPGAGITVTTLPKYENGSYAAGVWSDISLNPGQSATLVIYADVTALQGTVITNTAEVTAANEIDIDSTPNNGNTGEDDYTSVAFTVSPPNTDLALTLTADDTTPTVYDDVVFTLDIDEQGVNAATGVEVTLTLPTGLTYVSDTGTCTDSAVAGGTLVTCDIGAIALSGSASVTVTASVDEDADQLVALNVTGTVTSIQTDNNPADNDDSLSITPHANFFFVNVGPGTCGNRTFGATAMSGHWGGVTPASWEILGRRNVTFYQMYTNPSGLDWIGSVTYSEADSLTSNNQYYSWPSWHTITPRYPNGSTISTGTDAYNLYICRENQDELQVNFKDLAPGTYRVYYLALSWLNSWGWPRDYAWDVSYQIGLTGWTLWLDEYNPYSNPGNQIIDVELSDDSGVSITLTSTTSVSIRIGGSGEGITSGIGIEKLP